MMLYIEVSFTPYSEKFDTYLNLKHVVLMYHGGGNFSGWNIELSNGNRYCISGNTGMMILDHLETE